MKRLLPTTTLLLSLLVLTVTLCGSFSLRAQEDDRPIDEETKAAGEKATNAKLPTFYLAGDSTVKSNGPLRGWGQSIGGFFDPKKMNVVNRALGGRSSRTYFNEGRFESIVKDLKPGDWVIIQFGHNDVGRPDASSKFRGSLKGIGEDTTSVTKPDGTSETVHSYGWYLKSMAKSARAKGAQVVLCSPIPHKKFDPSGKFVRDWAEWRGWVAACAKETGSYYVDLSEIIARGYDKLPQPQVEALFADKGTHTNAEGALFNAKAVISGLKALPKNPLAAYFSPEGTSQPPAAP